VILLQLNEVFDGKYKILKILGKGGMGEVYLAQNINLGTLWAIKRVSKKGSEKIDLLAEPNILKKLKHPALPRIFDINEDQNYLYIVEDYIEGVSLDKELQRVERFPEKTIIEWAKQICDAFSYLHNLKPNPVIYRDMKPANIMATSENEIKIIDFGIAREYKEEAEGDTTHIGTIGYAAPEQRGTSQSDARTDIYSLGVTLYHLLTGKSPNEPPFEIIPVRKIDKKLSQGIEYIIKKCTQADPKKRYQSVEALLKDLNNIHKFDIAYKRKRVISSIKTLIFMGSMSVFTYLICLGFIQLDVEKNERYSSKVSEGKVLANEAEYDKALQIFKEASEEIPKRIEAYREISNMYLKKKDYDKCIDYTKNELLNRIPQAMNDSDLLYILGTAYFENKDYENSSKYFAKADEIIPYNVNYKRDLAVSYARMGNLNDARNLLSEIRDSGLAEEVSWYVDGEILAADKDFEKSLKSFEKCISISGDEVLKRKAFISFAQLLQDNIAVVKDAPNRLINILERAHAELKESNDIVIVEMLGKAYFSNAMLNNSKKNEYFKKANSNFEMLIQLGYNRPYIYRNISGIYKQLGELSKSEETLIKMKELYPQDYTCYESLAFLYAEIENRKANEKRNYSKTIEQYNLAIKYSPNGEDTAELKPLIKLMNDLRAGNWLK
jgi:serine/threonine protein kinase